MLIIKMLFLLMLALPFAGFLLYFIMKMAEEFSNISSGNVSYDEDLSTDRNDGSRSRAGRSNRRRKKDSRRTVYTSNTVDFSSYPKDPYTDFKRPDFDRIISAKDKNNE